MAKDTTKKTHKHEPELEIPDEYKETRQQPEGHPSRKETLCWKAEQEDGLVPTQAEFQEMLKDPDALYEDIIELIEKSRDFRAHRDNYRKQLIEVKQTMCYGMAHATQSHKLELAGVPPAQRPNTQCSALEAQTACTMNVLH
ncbi:hypothetical protein GP486_006535, partial [Trichoglossum hirsutum]